ncbi:hypothetical protein FRB99_004493 [Tulasnella sp. 403]|nr:hypothetical protein FRB99_004493 [Tulasnella sp. 403]
MIVLLVLLAAILLAGITGASVVPTAPGPGDMFRQGAVCSIQWNVDTTGDWKNMTIDLMSGSNLAMSKVTTVATGLDGTNPKLTPYNWTCPSVSPYSTIYFYQFSRGDNQTDTTWTTRFTITSSKGLYTSPSNSTQPGGEAIPWGVGVLVSNASYISSAALASASVNRTSMPTPVVQNATLAINSTQHAASSETKDDSSKTSESSHWHGTDDDDGEGGNEEDASDQGGEGENEGDDTNGSSRSDGASNSGATNATTGAMTIPLPDQMQKVISSITNMSNTSTPTPPPQVDGSHPRVERMSMSLAICATFITVVGLAY